MASHLHTFTPSHRHTFTPSQLSRTLCGEPLADCGCTQQGGRAFRRRTDRRYVDCMRMARLACKCSPQRAAARIEGARRRVPHRRMVPTSARAELLALACCEATGRHWPTGATAAELAVLEGGISRNISRPAGATAAELAVLEGGAAAGEGSGAATTALAIGPSEIQSSPSEIQSSPSEIQCVRRMVQR
jgi:hypothetical protein